MSWKEQLAKAYTTVPKSLREFAWKSGILGFAVAAGLTGMLVWRNPGVIFGKPIAEQSLIQRLSSNPRIKKEVFELMERFFYSYRPHGLMLVSWEEVNSLIGIWVRPANRFPGKSGPHNLTPDMRVLAGPFIFGECASTESLAMPGMIMVACPVSQEPE